MKVDEPEFSSWGCSCSECPLTDKHGEFTSDAMRNLCVGDVGIDCPENMEEYAEVCALAEKGETP